MLWLLVVWGCFGLLLSAAYFWIVSYFRRQWRALPEWLPPTGSIPETRITVLIPARNEEAHLGLCLESLLAQNYPPHLYEILVIDDHSTDGTVALVASIRNQEVRCLSLPKGINGKKQALAAGVAKARGELIVTTDADCRVPPDWLLIIASHFVHHRSVFLAGPVQLSGSRNLLQRFQSLDFMGMMLLTGAGFQSGRLLLANGANLAYPRAAFERVGGFSGVDHYASGDDVFLLRKMMSGAIAGFAPPAFLKARTATVHTEAKSSWRDFFNQRLRWATKNRPDESGLAGSQALRTAAGGTLLTLALVFLLCWSILLNLLLVPFLGWPLVAFFVVQIGVKAMTDYGMLREAARFFQREDLLRWFWVSQVLHILYIAIVGLLGNVTRRYEWKGRRVH